MAKIKPARGKKPAKGPKNPGAVGCLILLVSAFLLLALLLYYAFIYSAKPA
ncbi:MAG: hypothetical protein NZR01_15430 [Bryobacteraceae bacterium]|nr:hypothetical protein [Bryobacteraceae bacterium]